MGICSPAQGSRRAFRSLRVARSGTTHSFCGTVCASGTGFKFRRQGLELGPMGRTQAQRPGLRSTGLEVAIISPRGPPDAKTDKTMSLPPL